MDITPVLKKLFPEGSYGGQCGEFVHKLVLFGSIGNSYAEKKRFIQANGIIKYNIEEIGRGYRVGDLVVTSEGTFMGMGHGHVAWVIAQDSENIYLLESNFKGDGRVHYGRKLPKNSPNIYGIGRFPFRVKIGDMAELKVSCLMNNFTKQWGSGVFGEVDAWFHKHSNGKLKTSCIPVYTKAQNWWYEVAPAPFEGQFYKNIAKAYFNETVMPLRLPGSHVVAFCVNPKEWEGAVYGKRDLNEVGWYYPNTNPGQILISANEFDPCPWYFGMSLYKHALIHEIGHYLMHLNGLNDEVHKYDNPETLNLEGILTNLDYNRIIANI